MRRGGWRVRRKGVESEIEGGGGRTVGQRGDGE